MYYTICSIYSLYTLYYIHFILYVGIYIHVCVHTHTHTYIVYIHCNYVTKPKSILLITQQANKSGDELGRRIVTLFGKPEDLEMVD